MLIGGCPRCRVFRCRRARIGATPPPPPGVLPLSCVFSVLLRPSMSHTLMTPPPLNPSLPASLGAFCAPRSKDHGGIFGVRPSYVCIITIAIVSPLLPPPQHPLSLAPLRPPPSFLPFTDRHTAWHDIIGRSVSLSPHIVSHSTEYDIGCLRTKASCPAGGIVLPFPSLPFPSLVYLCVVFISFPGVSLYGAVPTCVWVTPPPPRHPSRLMSSVAIAGWLLYGELIYVHRLPTFCSFCPAEPRTGVALHYIRNKASPALPCHRAHPRCSIFFIFFRRPFLRPVQSSYLILPTQGFFCSAIPLSPLPVAGCFFAGREEAV